MARKPRSKKGAQAENIKDFAGPDHDKETIEQLAEQAKKANAKGGSNSEPPDEVVTRNFDAIELALIEIDVASRTMQKARAGLKAALDTAKTDCGSKAWAQSIQASVKLKRQGEKGGNGELVTEHRQIGRILRLKGVPLGVQFNLFAVPGAEDDGAPVAAMDAELQGQHAYSNGEKPENNPFQAGSAEHADWSSGWYNAQRANAASMGTNGSEAAAH